MVRCESAPALMFTTGANGRRVAPWLSWRWQRGCS